MEIPSRGMSKTCRRLASSSRFCRAENDMRKQVEKKVACNAGGRSLITAPQLCIPTALRRMQTFRTPLRVTWDVAGDPTETTWWPSRGTPKTILFFIPGNPGLVEYYTDFLEIIYRSAPDSLEIYGGELLQANDCASPF